MRKSVLLPAVIIVVILILLGLTGKMDYESGMREQCAEYNQTYDPEADACK